MRKLLWRLLLCCLICCCFGAHGQAPVLWQFDARVVDGDRATLYMTAMLAPGWHLYSQREPEGGPGRTRFEFRSADDFLPVGAMRESGNAIRYYDHLYEMSITTYKDAVSFEQDIRVAGSQIRVSGKVDFVACGPDICIPAQEQFSITIER